MRVFLDANILFSAADAESLLGQTIRAAAVSHQLVTSRLAADEASRNLAAKRSNLSAGLTKLIEMLEVIETESSELPEEIELVEKDRPILAAAIDSRCNLLVTGDRRHFGHLYDLDTHGVTVVSVQGLVDRLIG